MTHSTETFTHDSDPPAARANQFKSPWTEERIKQLVHLHSEKYSSSEIGALLGISRNAVIGKLTRLGFSKPKQQLTEEQRQQRALGQRARDRRKYRERSQAKAKNQAILCIGPSNGFGKSLRILESVASDMRPLRCAPVEPLNISLMELNAGTCRYPSGEGAEITFCGHWPRIGSPYCPAHSALAFVPVPQRRVA